MNHRIEMDEYVLMVEITDLTDIKPDPTSWASPDDYYGCREIEFSVISGVIYDEDDNVTELDGAGCAEVGEQHADLIEELLWRIVDGAKETEAVERAEAQADRIAAWRAA